MYPYIQVPTYLLAPGLILITITTILFGHSIIQASASDIVSSQASDYDTVSFMPLWLVIQVGGLTMLILSSVEQLLKGLGRRN
jgi:hypothetical protein